MCPKDADGMANSVDPDRTAPEEQSDQGLHWLPRPISPITHRTLRNNSTQSITKYAIPNLTITY